MVLYFIRCGGSFSPQNTGQEPAAAGTPHYGPRSDTDGEKEPMLRQTRLLRTKPFRHIINTIGRGKDGCRITTLHGLGFRVYGFKVRSSLTC